MHAVKSALFFLSDAAGSPFMNSTKKKHPNGHTAGHRGAKIKEKPAKLPHARAREADAKPPPARSIAPVMEPPRAQRSTCLAAVRAAGFDDDALEGGGAFACAADAAAKAKPAGKAGRARQKPP